ncbi:MAG: septum formation initiator family protein [Patescibacteria group bacterium]
MRRLLISKFIILLAIPVLVLLLFKLGEVLVMSYETNKDIRSLEKTIGDLEKSQRELREFTSFLQSDFFAEKEARLKLGLQKEGEIAVALSSPAQMRKSSGSQEDIADRRDAAQKSNSILWWEYFFQTEQK